MRRIRNFAVVFFACLLLVAVGCSSVGAHEKAIMDAVDDYEGSAFAIEKLADQLKAQKSSGSDSVSYDIEVVLPDYQKIDTGDIEYTVPELDFSDPDACRQALYAAIRVAMEQYVEDGGFDETTTHTLTFHLSKLGSAWTAEIDEKDARKMEKQIEETLAAKVAGFEPAPIELEMIQIAEQADAIAAEIFTDEAFQKSCRLTDVAAKSGNTFTVTLEYPDPAAAFKLAGDELYNGFAEPVFDSPDIELILDGSYSVAASALSKKTGTCTVELSQTGNVTVSDSSEIASAVSAARASAQKATADRIYQEWVIQPVDPPRADVVTGATSGYLFTIDCRKALSDYYFEFYKLAERDNVLSEQTFQYSVYITKGNRTDVRLTPGYYVAYYYWSNGPWYGPEYRFGPDGKSSLYTFTCAKGYNYTLTMRW